MILLDTHTLIWYLDHSSKLPQTWASTFSTSERSLLISAICFWEIALLVERGSLGGTSAAGYLATVRRSKIQVMDLTPEIALKSREVPLPHQDPADRFIAATALLQDAILATFDKNLLNHDWLPTLPF